MRDRPKGQAIKSISYRYKTDIGICTKKSLWYSGYRVCGGLCTRDKTHFSPLDVIKNLWGEGGTFPQR
jgi:hypothetical protein